MVKTERDVNNPGKNLEHLNSFRLSLNTVRELRSKKWAKEGSPLWWGTDYAPDPREYMDFREFKKRLVHLGVCKTSNTRFYRTDSYAQEKDVYLYPKPEVPMTILNLEVLKQTLPLLITARPYHEKEKFENPVSAFLLKNEDLEKLQEYVRSGGTIDLYQHFYPHVRGLFAGVKGNNLFWYPLSFNSFWFEFGEKIQKALDKKHLGFLGLYEPHYSDERTYVKVWDELTKRKDLIDMRPTWINFPCSEVSREELIEGKGSKKDFLVYYPLRVPFLMETLPLIISTRTHKESRNRKFVVLGIYAENGGHGYVRRGGILRIRDLEFARNISSKISEDFGMPVDTVLFTSQKGRPKYERISAV